MAAPPAASQLAYPYNLNFQSSTSVAIIIVVLGATFFFMFLFVIYIKRCNTERFDQGDGMMLSNPGGDGRGADGGGWNQQQQQQQRIHGLDPEVLQKFPILQFPLDRSNSKNKNSTATKKGKIVDGPVECAVCLGAFEEGELLRILPGCGHLFHPDCIDMWLHAHSTCPLCRRSLSRDAVSGHLLQRALAAIASLRSSTNAAAANETDSSPDNSTISPPVLALSPSPLRPPSAGSEDFDLESQQELEHCQILRALSRNSESFKAAAQSVEIQDRLLAAAASSSGRYNLSSSSNPGSTRLEFFSPRRLRSLSHAAAIAEAAPALSPIACGRMHHSQSLTDLIAGGNSPGCSQQQCQQADQSRFSLRRSVSASGRRPQEP